MKTRLFLLGGLSLGGFLYLKGVQWKRRSQKSISFKKLADTFFRLSRKKKLAILFLFAFAVYNLCVWSFVSKGYAFSGDEPYYLLTTHSLYQDKDINVANQYENRDYFHFYPKEQFPKLHLRAYARFGKKGTDYVYPINQPGISVLILPFYLLSRLFTGKVLIFILKGSLSIWAVLLGLQLYLLALEIWKKESLALFLWFLFSFTSPILFYAIHLYPEIPIAFFSVYIFRKIRLKHPLPLIQYIFCGFLLSLFLWFGLKYNIIFWPLLAIGIYSFLKNQKIGWKILGFLAFPVLSLGLFYFYLYTLYGSINPIVIYEGVLTPEKLHAFKEVMFKIPVMLRIDTFFDYFLDQRDGLLLYSPFYFFFFLGMVELFRKRKKEFFILILITLPYLINYAILSHRQGYGPQGRVLAPVIWAGAIFVGHFLYGNRKRIFSGIFWAATVVSFVFVAILLTHPSFLYQPTTHTFTFRGGALFIYLSNLYFYLPGFLPSFIKVNNLNYLPNYIWFLLALLFVGVYSIKKSFGQKKLSFPKHVFLTSLCLLFLTFWFAVYPRFPLLFPANVTYPSGHKIGFYSLGPHIKMRDAGHLLIHKDNHVYVLPFSSWRQIEKMKIQFGSLEGKYKVEIRLFDQMLFKGIADNEIRTLIYPSPPFYRFKNTHLYSLTCKLENLSDTDTAERPFSLNVIPLR